MSSPGEGEWLRTVPLGAAALTEGQALTPGFVLTEGLCSPPALQDDADCHSVLSPLPAKAYRGFLELLTGQSWGNTPGFPCA